MTIDIKEEVCQAGESVDLILNETGLSGNFVKYGFRLDERSGLETASELGGYVLRGLAGVSTVGSSQRCE